MFFKALCLPRRSGHGPSGISVFLFCKEYAIPKIKTRRAAAKRFQLTGSGKYKRRRQNLRHILTKKAPGRKMRLGQATLVDSTNEKAVRRMLPNG